MWRRINKEALGVQRDKISLTYMEAATAERQLVVVGTS
jgi:hypothetical protein